MGRMHRYDPMLDLARVSLEFGYVLMFTVVWPLAPLACLLLSVWNSPDPEADLDGSGLVDGADIGLLLSYWSG